MYHHTMNAASQTTEFFRQISAISPEALLLACDKLADKHDTASIANALPIFSFELASHDCMAKNTGVQNPNDHLKKITLNSVLVAALSTFKESDTWTQQQAELFKTALPLIKRSNESTEQFLNAAIVCIKDKRFFALLDETNSHLLQPILGKAAKDNFTKGAPLAENKATESKNSQQVDDHTGARLKSLHSMVDQMMAETSLEKRQEFIDKITALESAGNQRPGLMAILAAELRSVREAGNLWGNEMVQNRLACPDASEMGRVLNISPALMINFMQNGPSKEHADLFKEALRSHCTCVLAVMGPMFCFDSKNLAFDPVKTAVESPLLDTKNFQTTINLLINQGFKTKVFSAASNLLASDLDKKEKLAIVTSLMARQALEVRVQTDKKPALRTA